MPGTFVVDMTATFKSAVFMTSQPKLKFGTQVQETNAAGAPKWTVELAATFTPGSPGMPETSELLKVTVTGGPNPGDGLNPGTPVLLEGFRVGTNPPEKRDDGRIQGGRLWYTATGLRSAVAAANGGRRPAGAE